MANERKTESIVRNRLQELGYYDDEQLIIEEQKSDNELVAELLSKASKSGNGAGYPEFIIRQKNSDVLIVVECKADTGKHESPSKDKPKDYAVDGALHYASFLKKEFHVIAIGLSGSSEDHRLSTFQWNKHENRFLPRKLSALQTYQDYYQIFHAQDQVSLTEDELMQYAKRLHDQMRDEAKLKEAEKPLLVAALLLALDNDDFVREFSTIFNPKKLAGRIIESIAESLNNSNIKQDKIDTLIGEFSFIKTHTYLTSGSIDHQNPSHGNNSLHKFLVDIRSKVYPFVKKVNNIDIIGQFYSEFLRYTGGDGKGLGIVLTPTHITELFCDLAEVNKNSKVLDICTGTGGFLISAMQRMIQDDPTVAEIDHIYKHSLVGVETQTNMFALAAANMIIRGDGKTNLFQANCFEIPTEKLQEFGCNVGLINPPYGQRKEEEMELVFIKKLLDSLTTGGTAVAIIPQSAVMATKTSNDLKREILKNHTLKAVMSMPNEVFYPTNTVTCVVVFEAHKPHNENKKTWFGYWKEDGFEKVKNKGRVDLKEDFYKRIKPKWLDSFFNKKEIPGFSVLKSVSGDDEWLVEPYLETDYQTLSEKDFTSKLLEYSTFLFYNKLKSSVSDKPIKKEKIKLNSDNWKYFQVSELFAVSSTNDPLIGRLTLGGHTPYITSSELNNGITSYVQEGSDFGADTITANRGGSVGYFFYQPINYLATPVDVRVLSPQFNINPYIGQFLVTILQKEKYRFNFSRKMGTDRLNSMKIKLPAAVNGQPDWDFMENYIKSLPYSENLNLLC